MTPWKVVSDMSPIAQMRRPRVGRGSPLPGVMPSMDPDTVVLGPFAGGLEELWPLESLTSGFQS